MVIFLKKWHFVIFIGVSQNLKFNRFLHFLEMFCTVHPILMFLKNVGLPQKYYRIPGYSDTVEMAPMDIATQQGQPGLAAG